MTLSTPETVASKPDQGSEGASPRELAARNVARLTKESMAAEAEWGRDSTQAVAARIESDKKLGEVDYEVASEGVARGYDLKPHNLDEATVEAANGDNEQQRLQRDAHNAKEPHTR
jgi:hypothetical protein